MCDQCDYCFHSKYCGGTERGIMDCDPPEYWCSVDGDYYYLEDSEILCQLREEFIADLIAAGTSEEEAEEMAEGEDFEVNCPHFLDAEPWDKYDRGDYEYDMMRDEGLL